MTIEHRGTSNTNDRGSAESRRRRKNWLLQEYGADVDVVTAEEWVDLHEAIFDETDYLQNDDDFFLWVEDRFAHPGVVVLKGLGRPACRCFRCGKLVTFETMEVDRIVPGCVKTARYPNGGTYVRENIRPCCPDCNKIIAVEEGVRRRAKRKKRNEQKKAWRATRDRHFAEEELKVAAIMIDQNEKRAASIWEGYAGE